MNNDPSKKTATPAQRIAAYEAIRANPKIKIALDAAGIDFESFAAYSDRTLEGLAAIQSQR